MNVVGGASRAVGEAFTVCPGKWRTATSLAVQ